MTGRTRRTSSAGRPRRGRRRKPEPTGEVAGERSRKARRRSAKPECLQGQQARGRNEARIGRCHQGRRAGSPRQERKRTALRPPVTPKPPLAYRKTSIGRRIGLRHCGASRRSPASACRPRPPSPSAIGVRPRVRRRSRSGAPARGQRRTGPHARRLQARGRVSPSAVAVAPADNARSGPCRPMTGRTGRAASARYPLHPSFPRSLSPRKRERGAGIQSLLDPRFRGVTATGGGRRWQTGRTAIRQG